MCHNRKTHVVKHYVIQPFIDLGRKVWHSYHKEGIEDLNIPATEKESDAFVRPAVIAKETWYDMS